MITLTVAWPAVGSNLIGSPPIRVTEGACVLISQRCSLGTGVFYFGLFRAVGAILHRFADCSVPMVAVNVSAETCNVSTAAGQCRNKKRGQQ